MTVLVLFAILPFFATALGGLAALRFQHRLHPLMALAAGMLVATALSDLMPEGRDLLGESAGRVPFAAAVVAGYLLFSAVDALVHAQNWERLGAADSTHSDGESLLHPTRLGLARSAGMIIHSLLDGIAIGLSFASSPKLGVLVAVAVLAHDFADGMNVVTLALAAGQSERAARIILILDALAPPLGVVVGSKLPLSDAGLGFALAIFAGVFLAIGAGHLLPEAQHRQPGIAPSLVLAAAIGAALILGVQSVLG